MRCLGPDGEHKLLGLATRSRVPAVRVAAVQALTLPLPVPEPLTANPHYEHSNHANFVRIVSQPEPISADGPMKPLCLQQDEEEDVIVLDPRELLDVGRTVTLHQFTYCEHVHKQQYQRYYIEQSRYPSHLERRRLAPRVQQPPVEVQNRAGIRA